MSDPEIMYSLALIASAQTVGVDPFEELRNEGYNSIAVYSSTYIGHMMHYWASYTRNWIDVYTPKASVGLQMNFTVGHYQTLDLSTITTHNYDILLIDNYDWPIEGDLKALLGETPLLNINSFVKKMFIEKTYYSPILKLAAKLADHNKVLVCYEATVLSLKKRYGDSLSPHEQHVACFMDEWRAHRSDPEFDDPIWKANKYTDDYVLECIPGPEILRHPNGLQVLANRTSNCVNVVSNHRLTTNVPDSFQATIWVFGSSKVFGSGSDDSHTIPSCLQKLINKSSYNYRVVNCSNYAGAPEAQQIRLMETLPIQPNDITVFMTCREDHFLPFAGQVPTIDLNEVFRRPHQFGEVFWDDSHMNSKGNEIVADALFAALMNNGAFSLCDVDSAANSRDKNSGNTDTEHAESNNTAFFNLGEDMSGLEQYLGKLKLIQKPIGSVVMNCNPFTMGHRYLVETAAGKVAHLYVFVVEEDSSYFPFATRIKLVQEGLADLQNVTVIPSGEFIISLRTFDAYSHKDKLQDKVIDASTDVHVFGKYIAPSLDITVRSVGDEPIDAVTRQYNAALLDILPRYGVDLVVIPRKAMMNEPISASRVRRLLKERDFASISLLVPQTTLNYLQEHYGQQTNKQDP
ncbi:MAG: hypothetical protein LBD25_04175 [Coriobacteriales bacterium]|jgi:[citrate (pro-3S)-lyase] ligase|nr:hypothetical protein [Coriobacteriales bacterium]